MNIDIQHLENNKNKYKEIIKKQLRTSTEHRDKIEGYLKNVRQITENQKSKLQQLFNNSSFEFIEIDNTTEEKIKTN